MTYRCIWHLAELPLLILLISLTKPTFSQNQHVVDSLLVCLKTAKPDTSKVNILYQLAKIYCNNDLVRAAEYASHCRVLSEKCGYKKGVGKYYELMSLINSNKGDYTQSLAFGRKLLSISEEIADSSGMSHAYGNMAADYSDMGYYPEALKNHLAALKIREKIGDKPGIAANYVGIGIVYHRQSNVSDAIKNFRHAMDLCEEIGDTRIIAYTFNLLGDVYKDLHNYQEAMHYYSAGLKVSEETGNKSVMSNSFNGLGVIHYLEGNYPEALRYHLTALKIREEFGEYQAIAESYTNIGDTYYKQKKYNDAYKFLNKGLTLSKEVGALFEIKSSYQVLSAVDSSLGNFKQALEHYKLFIIFRDSLMNDENSKRITQQQMQYEFDKKESQSRAEQEKKNAVAEKEIQKQKLVRNGFIGGFAVVLLFAGVFFKQRNKIKKGNAALQVAKDRAEQSEQFKQQFLANMSHEIRTPMNAVMGMTSLVLNTALQEKQKFYLEGIRKSSDTLLHIINDILDLSKIEAGKMELEKIDFSLNDTLRQVKQTLNHRAEEKGLELIVNIEPGIDDVVIGDPVRLNQVLINLAGNAIKFTEKGSVTIELTKGEKESAVQFSIIDTGIGIPQEKLQTVFENFSQANASDTRKYGGTGLGLSISRQLVELMGGKISIASVEGSGTTFSFSVAFEKGSPERLDQRLASEEQVDGSILDGLSILVVDDNEYNRIVAKDTLESKSKVHVIAVESGVEAIELLKATDFDVVLMDVQMPVMNGFEATGIIRKGGSEMGNLNRREAELGGANCEVKNPSIPVIALTASVLRTDLDKCTAAGMDGYIPKPFRASQLIIGIAQVLNIPLRAEKRSETNNIPVPTVSSGVTNLDYLTKFCEGDRARMKKYIDMFLASTPTLIEKIKIAMQNSDYAEIASQMHGYKTKFMMMGMQEEQLLAAEIEVQCMEDQRLEPVKLQLQHLMEQVEIAVNELKSA
jgi:signal transduction histidine kinase/DNA-binding NarL/FixJ family response regulator